MKNIKWVTLLVTCGILLTLSIGVQAQGSEPSANLDTQTSVGTAFTYQGRLEDESGPVDDICNFKFTLYGSATGTDQVGTPQNKTGVRLDDGYFSVELNFGSNVFQGAARHMKIEVDCSSGFVELSPRVALTPAPYALALPGLWTQQNETSFNIIAGFGENSVTAGVVGATISGGGESNYANLVTDDMGTVGGGAENQAGDDAGDVHSAVVSTVGGGWGNTASANVATVGGGYANTASGASSTVGGGNGNVASEYAAAVGGGAGNTANGHGAVIAGGGGWDEASSSLITNTINGDWSTIGGGRDNTIDGEVSTIGGGRDNTISGNLGFTISGGEGNSATGEAYGTISGGWNNTVSYNYATVGGGQDNTASGRAATVPGGDTNTAEGWYSFAAGRNANAAHTGAFVWADSNDHPFLSNSDNQFSVRSTGGARFVLAINATTGLPTWTCSVANGSSWACTSDRNQKENLIAVDGEETLTRLSQVPIFTWNAVGQDPANQHIGPMAQDFYAAFGVGEDNLRISTIDLDGVALSAIQGLNSQNQALLAENAVLHNEIDDLEARIDALEVRMSDGNPTTPISASKPLVLMFTFLAGMLLPAGLVWAVWHGRGDGQ